MRYGKNTERLSKVIEADRLSDGAFTSDLMVCDLKSLLKDYFELTCSPKVEITATDNGYIVTVTAAASRIKSFRRID